MSLTVTRRAATADEGVLLRELRERAGQMAIGLFLVVLAVGIVAEILQAVLNLIRRAVPMPWWVVDVLPWVLAGAAVVLIAVDMLKTVVELRRRAETAASQLEVDEVVVRDAQVRALDDASNAWCFEAAPGRLLLLMGPRLTDHTVYGAPKPGKRSRVHLNGLEPPHAFPSAAFTLVRDPCSGEVVSIRVEGPYLAPTEVPQKVGRLLRNSELLSGSFADLGAALKEA